MTLQKMDTILYKEIVGDGVHFDNRAISMYSTYTMGLKCNVLIVYEKVEKREHRKVCVSGSRTGVMTYTFSITIPVTLNPIQVC